MKKVLQTLFAFSLLLSIQSAKAQTDSLEIRIKLSNPNDLLQFDQQSVKNNSLEYEWAVYFDTDNNNLSGNSEGYDCSVGISKYKFNSSPGSGPILSSATQKSSYILSGFTGTFGHEFHSYMDKTTSEIVLVGATNWIELSAINGNTKFSAKTIYYDGVSYYFDNTESGTVKTNILDAEGDVSKGFIDILSVKVAMKFITNIGNDSDAGTVRPVYPNPCSDGLLHFPEGSKISISDMAGDIINTEVLSVGILDLRNKPKGAYLAKVHYNGKIWTEKVVLN